MHFQDVGGTLVDVDSVVMVERDNEVTPAAHCHVVLAGGPRCLVALPSAEVRALVLARAAQREKDEGGQPLTVEDLNAAWSELLVLRPGPTYDADHSGAALVLDRLAERQGLDIRFSQPPGEGVKAR